MNEFERRYLDIVQNASYLQAAVRQGQKVINVEYFNYNTRIGTVANPIAAGGQAQGTVQIQSDSDFVLTYISADVTDAAGTTIVTNPGLLMQITDTGSGKTFFSEPTLITLVTGRLGIPFQLPSPRIIPPNTNIQFTLQNLAAVAYSGAFISLLGARIYYA